MQAAALAVTLGACSTIGSAPRSDDPQVWCDLNEPRRHSPEVIDLMSEVELEKLNAHNRYGEQHCGWKP
jgi:hypothetical protein